MKSEIAIDSKDKPRANCGVLENKINCSGIIVFPDDAREFARYQTESSITANHLALNNTVHQ